MKRTVIIISVIFLLLFGSLQLYVFLSRPTPTEELRIRLAQLPEIVLTGLDGSEFSLPSDKPLVLIYFNSECDHCQRELKDIREHIELFSSSSVVLMSSQSLEEFTSFANGLNFVNSPNVRFGRIRPEQLAETFGQLALPQIFLFAGNGKLITLFSGEKKASEIAASIR